jgi:sugar transferase (PEP-CTERM system associated)
MAHQIASQGSLVFRLFNLYFTTRKLFLLLGEIAIITASFLLAAVLRLGDNSKSILLEQHGLSKIFVITLVSIVCSHYLDLYDLRRVGRHVALYFRFCILVCVVAVFLAVTSYAFPAFVVGPYVYPTGLCILLLAWICWRWVYNRLLALPILRQRVYLLGSGERARRLIKILRARKELGTEIVGWAGETGTSYLTRDSLSKILQELGRKQSIDRVIVALADRRATMPLEDLLTLKLSGIKIQDGTGLLEEISGQVEVDELRPAWLVFSEGFRLSSAYRVVRRVISVLCSVVLLLLTLPLIPIIIVVIKLTSPGPVLYCQERTGLRGSNFFCYKFRTMRPDAEADTGPTWASDDDPRITGFGRILRRTRLDEIPQLWSVLRGDMGFIGPRPERPEFVEKLNKEIPYYGLRHIIRPGLTGWAQINFGYCSSVEEAKEKLRYDLYYIKNGSLALDFIILFETAKTVVFGRGAR